MISWDLYKASCVKLCSSCSSMEFVYLDAQFYRNRAIKKNTLKNWCVSIICSCSTVADFINMYYNNKNTFINNQGTDIGECCGGVGKELQSLLSKAQIVEVLLFAFTSKVKTKQNYCCRKSWSWKSKHWSKKAYWKIFPGNLAVLTPPTILEWWN